MYKVVLATDLNTYFLWKNVHWKYQKCFHKIETNDIHSLSIIQCDLIFKCSSIVIYPQSEQRFVCLRVWDSRPPSEDFWLRWACEHCLRGRAGALELYALPVPPVCLQRHCLLSHLQKARPPLPGSISLSLCKLGFLHACSFAHSIFEIKTTIHDLEVCIVSHWYQNCKVNELFNGLYIYCIYTVLWW